MGGLESIVRNLGRGLAMGAAKIIDPVGNFLSYIDNKLTGAGYATERSLPNIHNHIYRSVASNFRDKQSGATSYLPRFIGGAVGFVGTLVAYTAATFAAPVVGLAALGGTSAYCLGRAAFQYVKDSVNGEKIGNTYQKGSFSDGFKYGFDQGSYGLTLPTGPFSLLNPFNWVKSTISPAQFFHGWENGLTGRGYEHSNLHTGMTRSAGGMRRNFRAIAGSIAGYFTGFAVSRASFETLPLYRNGAWIHRQANDTPLEQRRPAHIVDIETPEVQPARQTATPVTAAAFRTPTPYRQPTPLLRAA